MIFGRHAEKRVPLLTFERILVPLAGTEADEPALRLAALLIAGSGGQAMLLHVIEVPFERQLDAEDAA
ncbi:MAG TPA: universal stress protein, partial [Candidatus Limnocylindrales bacterium]|nr:universal stress protein [Candidatus Limnocylindrales bacterium]